MAARPGPHRVAALALLLIFAVVALWNASAYDWAAGYDALEHKQYADLLVHEGELPRGTGSYYTPPGFYALAGTLEWLGRRLGLDEPVRLVQYANALLVLASLALVLALAHELWPERPTIGGAALGFVVICPLAAKAAAMFHPETLDLFLSTVALLLAARMIVRRRFSPGAAVALGLVLGAAQLVRAFSLWTVAVVAVALGAALVADPQRRAAAARALALVLLVAAAVPAPWYVHQTRLYTNPIFDRPQPPEPLWERRPASFYVDLAIPEVVERPYRTAYSTSFLPVLYTETWGDYFGVWAWGGAKGGEPDDRVRVALAAQALAGLVPTLLGVTGVLATLAIAFRRWRSRPELLLAALLPVAGLAGLLHFAVAYPTPDGDTIKGLYMLTTLPAWALAFGLAVDVLARGRMGRLLLVSLAAAATASVPFGVYAWT